MFMLLLRLSILLLLPMRAWCDMMIPHPFLPYDHNFCPWPESSSYPYMLDKDMAVLAVVSAGCLYLVRVSTQQVESEKTRLCSVSDARAAIAEKLKMPTVHLWQVTCPWVLGRIHKKDPVEAKLLDDDTKHLPIDSQRFLLLAADGDGENQTPENIPQARFNKLVTRRSLTLARCKHGFLLIMYTLFCLIPMCMILIALLLIVGLICGPVFLCVDCYQKFKERKGKYFNENEVTTIGKDGNK
mmetsp:Transcript_53716/g.96565  ORF Transcript_53716/g.96565 Transcript_53716/m.96565 type:complete len:242 (-) Transcript_53716:155-880(-)